MRLVWHYLTSLTTCIVLLLALCAVMAVGSFLLVGDRAASINAMSLLEWLVSVPVAWSWWLWLAVVILVLLVFNTLACSWDTLASRWHKCRLMTYLPAQLMHAGFLLVVLAHGISGAGSSLEQFEVAEHSIAGLPDGRAFGVTGIRVTTSSSGMPTGFACEIVPAGGSMAERIVISPNHPWISGGYGVYLKQAAEFPFRRALLEIHREPGAGMALAGALLFTVGNLVLLWRRGQGADAQPVGGAL